MVSFFVYITSTLFSRNVFIFQIVLVYFSSKYVIVKFPVFLASEEYPNIVTERLRILMKNSIISKLDKF